MSVNSVSAPQSVESLISQLAQQMGDKNGQVSSTDFATLLYNFVAAIEHNAITPSAKATGPILRSVAADAVPSGSTTADPTSSAADVDPSTWTDNNAPYGVTFAGFSPQNHTELKLADLSNPMNAKYAAYNYLLSNQVTPGSDWAAGAAAALNQKYGTTIFHAIDGETLGYGDEYIHSARNGYGMANGTFNPTATGEFFWGSTS